MSLACGLTESQVYKWGWDQKNKKNEEAAERAVEEEEELAQEQEQKEEEIDIIESDEGGSERYDPLRGQEVIKYVREFFDNYIPLEGTSWKNISKEVSQSFTPREIHVGKKLRVVISYVDGQGNLETLISPPSSTVKNVNDKPTGSARLIGSPVEDSALVVDTSSISDEDGIGGFEISWQRSSSQSDWEAFPSEKTEVLRLQQEHVNYSFRAVVSYVDSHGTREVLYTSPSESIDNLDDPVQGDVTINGSPREGSILKAISNSLSDEDGIASINISWEKSKDGRNWIALNSVSGPSLNLNQDLVGFQIRTRVAVVDNFGIETNLYSLATRTVENVNNRPSGRIIIRRVGQ